MNTPLNLIASVFAMVGIILANSITNSAIPSLLKSADVVQRLWDGYKPGYF